MKYTYTFSVNGRHKSITAKSMQEALNEITWAYSWSFTSRKIYFISSNDPQAPVGEHLVFTKDLFSGTTIMQPVEKSEVPQHQSLGERIREWFSSSI